MIPEFPSFKKINIEDRKSIESYTSQFLPYSDFNFTSLWTWDTKGERMISILNGNLVIRFTDYGTCEPFFSFLGVNDPENTVRKLIDFSNKSGLPSILRFIPEEAVTCIQKSGLNIVEDEDNFDYIYSIPELVNLKGIKFKAKRHSATKFIKEYPGAYFEIVDLNNNEVSKQIILVLECWNNKKNAGEIKAEFKQEEIAINKLLQSSANHKLIASCIYLRGSMIGFSIDEILPLGYAMSHFFKADTTYKGIYDFMNQKVSEYLATQGVALWNWEQDLGDENLRKSKRGYHSVSFLKKYIVSLTNK